MKTPPDNPNPPPDPLAVALAKLDPAPHGFEWHALMFAAGRASKARALARWRLIAGTCALSAVGFATAYFTRPTIVTERERIIYMDRAPVPPTPAVPPPGGPGPVAPPNAKPDPKPEPPSGSGPEPAGWTFDPPPPQGAAARWFNTRNEILSVGLSVLPDQGNKVTGPGTEK